MDENKSTVLPAGHVVEIKHGKTKIVLYNTNSVAFSVIIRKAKKGEKSD